MAIARSIALKYPLRNDVRLCQAAGCVSATIPSEIARRFHLAHEERVQAIETEHSIPR